MAPSTSRWNAFEVLDVDPDSAGFTCVGHAKTQGRRCRNIIAYANRDEAVKILQDMSERNVHSSSFTSPLKSLATRLLCRRWHVKDQCQIDSKVEQWKGAIGRYRSAENARRVRSSATETPAARQNVAPPATPCLMDTLESLRREITILNERYANALQLAASAPVASSSSGQSSQRLGTNSMSPSANQSSRTNNGRPTTISPTASVETEVLPHGEENQGDRHGNRGSTPQSQASEPDTVPNSPLAEAETPSEVQPNEPADTIPRPRTTPRQPIEGDCSVCCEDLADGDGITWCRAQCGQNFHADCIGIWLATQDYGRRLATCPYW